MLAALDVEASVELDGLRYNVGGYNQTCQRWLRSAPHSTAEEIFSTCAYLNHSQTAYARPANNASAFQYSGHSTGPIEAPFPYTPTRFSAGTPWPPLGLRLTINFTAPRDAPGAVQGVRISVYKGGDIIWHHASRLSRPCPAPYTPCAMLCLVATRMGC